MAEYKGKHSVLHIVSDIGNNKDGMYFKVIHEGSAHGVAVRVEDLRTIQKQIAEHLGDAPKPLPVGTIVVGKGLTEAQKQNTELLARAPALLTAASAIMDTVHWSGTAEGPHFWQQVYQRLQNLATESDAEKKRQEEAKRAPPVSIADFTVSTNATVQPDCIRLRYNNQATDRLKPAQARELAQALLRHADAAEKSG